MREGGNGKQGKKKGDGMRNCENGVIVVRRSRKSLRLLFLLKIGTKVPYL